MMRTAVLVTMLAATALRASEPLTFDEVLRRSLARSSEAASEQHAELAPVESAIAGPVPLMRVESAVQRTDELNALAGDVVDLGSMTTIFSIDVPLFARTAAKARHDLMLVDAAAARIRTRAGEARRFRETVDAFGRLYLAQERLRLHARSAERARSLRSRATTLLASGAVSTLTAASWQEAAAGRELLFADLELERLEAESELKRLMADPSAEALEVTLDRSGRVARPDFDEEGERAALRVARARLEVALHEQQTRPQWLFSGFGGVAVFPESGAFRREGTLGLYGARITLSAPLRRADSRSALARAELADAVREQREAGERARARTASLLHAVTRAERRIRILQENVELARAREQSMGRLVSGGLRTEADLLEAGEETARRESDLLTAKVERWKAMQLLGRGTDGTDGTDGTNGSQSSRLSHSSHSSHGSHSSQPESPTRP